MTSITICDFYVHKYPSLNKQKSYSKLDFYVHICQSANTYSSCDRLSRVVDITYRHLLAILLSTGNVCINRLKCIKLLWWKLNENSALSADDWRTTNYFYHFDWMVNGFCIEKWSRKEKIRENGFCWEFLVVDRIRKLDIVHLNEAEERTSECEW